jgi:RimJ/RimL family protein N-acetyltransferase
MIEIHSNQVTPELDRMFEQDMPTVVRALAVLGGGIAGKIFTDNPSRPSWGLVQENDDGTLYLGGQVDRHVLGEAIAALRKPGVVCLAFREGDANLELFPPDPDDTVDCLEFDRPIGSSDLTPYLANISPGFTVQRMDRPLLERSPRRDEYLSRYGSFENLLDLSIAVCILHEGEAVCDAFADMEIKGRREIGIRTHKEYRWQGLATIACSYLIQLCEESGAATYWDCNKSNAASIALARKLGFQNEREYRAFVFKPKI